MTFCTACGASLAAETRFCGACGAAAIPQDSKAPTLAGFSQDAQAGKRNLWLWIGLGSVFLLGLLYYFIYIYDDRGDGGGATPVGSAQEQVKASAIVALFAATGANIRDKPSTDDSVIIAKLVRGDAVRGHIVTGPVEGEQWLELADAKGFVSMVNLSKNPAPALKTSFGEKNILLASAADMWNAPMQDAQLLDRLSKGLTISASGITENGYLEIILRKGGVGYIADGAKIVADAELANKVPVISIKLDNNGCAGGAEVSALFKQITDANAAGLKKVENASYPNDDARDAAIDNYQRRSEGKSSFLRLKRNFNGLTVTGVGLHYESQSVYFDDPPEKVRAVFRAQGYKVARDGKLSSSDIYASIDAASREFSSYGKTDLGCGV